MAKRHKHKIEPIKLEDLFNSPAMEGLVSFLNYRPGEITSLPPINSGTSPEPFHPNSPLSTVDSASDHRNERPASNEVSAASAFKSYSIVVDDTEATVPSDSLATVDTGPRYPILDSSINDCSSELGEIEVLHAPAPTVGSRPVVTVTSDAVVTVDSGSQPTVDDGSAFRATNHVRPSRDQRDRVDASPQEFAPEAHTQRYPVAAPLPTVASARVSSDPHIRALGKFWITEAGQTVSHKQVRPFRLAQEILNSNERTLYSAMWGSRQAIPLASDSQLKEIQAGYETLAKYTNMSKRTVQRILPRLLEKGFVERVEYPNFINRAAAVYCILSFKRVLENCAGQGRTFVAKLGHGVAFVHPLPTVASDPPSTMASLTTVTMGKDPLATVAKLSALPIRETNFTRKVETTSATRLPEKLIQTLQRASACWSIEFDADAALRLWESCREQAPDARLEEVVHFLEVKCRVIAGNRAIKNPVGLLLHAVPKCFSLENLAQYREEEQRRLAAEQEAARRIEEDLAPWMEAILVDPKASNDDKEAAREWLQSRNRLPTQP